MENATNSHKPDQEIAHALAQQYAISYIQQHHSSLVPEKSYLRERNHPDQLWQHESDNGTVHWVFFNIILTSNLQLHSPSSEEKNLEKASRAYLELTLDEMLLSEHLPNQTLSLVLNEALQTDQLRYYHLNICLHSDDLELDTIEETLLDLSAPLIPEDQINFPDAAEQTILDEPPDESTQDPPPSAHASRFSPEQRAKQLSEQLSPHGFPIASKLNKKLSTPAQIKPIKDRYGQISDLILEYSPSISEAELTELLSRLGLYESFKHLERQHIFVQEKMQAWFKQNKQPSPGAIAPHLQQSILQLRTALERRITTLLDHQLKNLTAAELNAELNDFKVQQQQQQTIFKQIDQNAVLGYLDTSLLDQDGIRQTHSLFTSPHQAIDISAKHLKNRDDKIILTLIDSCKSEKYTSYLKRKQRSDEQNLFVGYTITQKLYPNRSIFIGEAPKAVFPRLECLWGHTDEPTMQPNPFTQIWCIYPMIRTDSAQWIVIAGTTDHQPLKTIALENGKMAQEGTYEYLLRSLFLMAQSEDEYTQALAGLVSEAVEQKRVKYLHVHQTLDEKTEKPRDMIQMQFQFTRG